MRLSPRRPRPLRRAGLPLALLWRWGLSPGVSSAAEKRRPQESPERQPTRESLVAQSLPFPMAPACTRDAPRDLPEQGASRAPEHPSSGQGRCQPAGHPRPAWKPGRDPVPHRSDLMCVMPSLHADGTTVQLRMT